MVPFKKGQGTCIVDIQLGTDTLLIFLSVTFSIIQFRIATFSPYRKTNSNLSNLKIIRSFPKIQNVLTAVFKY